MSAWTDSMVARLRAAAPLNFEKAQALALEFGNVTARSVVAKAVSEKIAYEKAERASKRGNVTKADLVEQIEANTGQSMEGFGFDKANARGLAWLVAYTSRDAS